MTNFFYHRISTLCPKVWKMRKIKKNYSFCTKSLKNDSLAPNGKTRLVPSKHKFYIEAKSQQVLLKSIEPLFLWSSIAKESDKNRIATAFWLCTSKIIIFPKSFEFIATLNELIILKNGSIINQSVNVRKTI